MRKISHDIWAVAWSVVFGLVGLGFIAWDWLRDRIAARRATT
jgi:hypothetical protein